jgi:hypothetical protein
MSGFLTNTQYFREAAIDFERNVQRTGISRYTLAPRKSKEWWEYWKIQESRCLNGYKVGDTKITGRHYFYLNFTPIKRTVGKGKTERKIDSFPAFWQIDYDWWWYKEIAWYGVGHAKLKALNLWRDPVRNALDVDDRVKLLSLNADLHKIPEGYILDTHNNEYVYKITYGGGKHLSCLKTRRAGFSFKEAADGVYNYNFISGSKSYFLADKEDYLIKDGILNKVQADLDWLNKYTDGYWLKNRHRHNTLMHQEAAYVDKKDKQVKGTKSEIIGVTIAGDPEKARGKDGLKITCEEAGSFTNLKAALGIIVPSVRAGATITGQISVFGTGGEEGTDIEGLDEIFNDPAAYDMLPFVNDWEDGYESTECGVFIPCYMANPTYIGEDGNTAIEAAIAFDDAEREKKKKAKDPKEIDRRMAEFPRTPSEALIRVSVNNFPVAEAKYQLNRVLRDMELQGLIKNGQFERQVEGLKFIPQPLNVARPINKYPHKKDDDLEGCISILKDPEKDSSGNVPDGLYIINVDPFYDDEAEDTTSLGSIYVTKLFNNYTPTHVMDVAWFNGRPRYLRTFYEAIFNLAEYFNAKVQCELGGGGKGVYDYAVANKKLKYLAFSEGKDTKEIQIDGKNRAYLMTISTEDKRLGLSYYQDHLREAVGLSELGVPLLNIHFVYDLGLLWEIIKFNPLKNADRISVQVVKQLRLKGPGMLKKAKDKKKRRRLIDRGLFGDTMKDPMAEMKVVNGELQI